ncbi:malonate decarboxylase holo-ACP synthase [Solimicrobium silvestre]|uniref:Malonate decarboxylase holo-[acyl-carrier-protein] synthase n=1 Tax=Solimicrobium silvestre TaxID=2099400 RepID=A0A2S9H414_9BURK|nr:malonate decarboxylase holo-ACP synthase [Solimicrobium silvestre]PRC94725.1 Malonate decarboxylase holo-[acyl-carrier-protein] synthase [Solimicrobium silvestre]
MKTYRPHDLLFIRLAHQQRRDIFNTPLPSWVNPHWPVVVRRAPPSAGGVWLPVGLRGTARFERLPAMMRSDVVQDSVSPESLLAEHDWQRHLQGQDFPCVRALHSIAGALNALGLSCGPTGSVGFALATGASILRIDSDLDLLVRAPNTISNQQSDKLQHIKELVVSHQCRIDIQIDTGNGGFAFDEWARNPKKVLLKTATGPILTATPWISPMELDA